MSGIGSSLGGWFKKEGKAEGETAEGDKNSANQTPQDEPSPANVSNKSVKGSAGENEDATSQHSGLVSA